MVKKKKYVSIIVDTGLWIVKNQFSEKRCEFSKCVDVEFFPLFVVAVVVWSPPK